MKKFLTLIVILGVAGGSLIGIFAMNHRQNSHKNLDCLVSLVHTSACPVGALPMASHSISMYQAFTNGLVSSGMMQILMIALLFVAVVFVLRRDIVLIPHLFILSRNFRAKLYRPQALTRWLSLLINSPAFN